MSELVVTLWFEDVGFLHEQMLDTPVGRFSIRQMGIFLIFGLLAWVGSLVFVDLVLKLVVAGGIFFTGAVFFTRKIKTISPEAHLFYLFRNFLQTTKQKHSTSVKHKQTAEQTAKPVMLLATLGTPVKAVGVLRDFSGKPLTGKPFQVNINNTSHSKGTTDQEGHFCIYFVPDHPGLFHIAIQTEGTPKPLQQITVNVTPKETKER